MNRSPRVIADPTGSYVANIISKGGRNEIQILNVDGSSSHIQASVAVKFELSTSECILDVMWLIPCPQKSGSRSLKRKQGASDVDGETSFIQPQLVALLQTNEIVVMLPTHSTIIKRISPEPKIIRFVGLSNSTHIWALADSPKLIEIALGSGAVSRSNKFKEDESIYIGSLVASKSAKSVPLFLAGSAHLFHADAAKVRLPVLHKSSINSTKIDFVQVSTISPNIFYIASENSSHIFVHNIEDLALISTLKASSEVSDLNLISIADDEILMVTTALGIEMFHVNSKKRCGTIKSSTGGHPLSGVFVHQASKNLVGVFHDVNEPSFKLIDCKLPPLGDIEVEIASAKSDTGNLSSSGHQIQLPDTCTINNESAQVLMSKFEEILLSADSTRVISLCCQNDDSNIIKEAVMKISLSKNATELVNLMFSSISSVVSADAADTTSLPIWLKWLLLLHGGSIARDPNQNDKLKELQAGLGKGMALLPHMLALQGRLKLLKAQAEFRESMVALSLDDDSGEKEESASEQQPQTFAYANGENDDDDVFENGDADVDDDDDAEI